MSIKHWVTAVGLRAQIEYSTSRIWDWCVLYCNANFEVSFLCNVPGKRKWLFRKNFYPSNSLYLRVRIHQHSRVESNPVQSDSQRRGRHSVAYLNGRRGSAYTPVESSRVESSPVQSSLMSLAESKVLVSPASFSSVRLQW